MNDGDREIINHFEWMRGNTIELTRRIPNEFLLRTPEGESHKVHWLLAHAGSSGAWWMSNVMRDGGREFEHFPDTKPKLIEEMEWWRDRVTSFFSSSDGNNMGQVYTFTDEDGEEQKWTGRNRLFYFIAHESDHYGRLQLAFRQWGFADAPWTGCE